MLTVALGCGPGSRDDPELTERPEPVGVAPDLSRAGAIVGRALFGGDIDPAVILDMGADPYCARLQRSEQHAAPRIRVNTDRTLRDVLVYVSAGLEGLAFPDPTPEEALFGYNVPGVLDQADCTFRPPIVALRTRQSLTIRKQRRHATQRQRPTCQR